MPGGFSWNRGKHPLAWQRTGPTVAEVYFWDGWQTVEETNSAGTLVRQYVWGEGIDECLKASIPDKASDLDNDSVTNEKVDLYYHHNSLGSVVAVTNAVGGVVESYRYSAFGKPTIYDEGGSVIAATYVEQPFMFTGARYDFEEGSGLYQMRHRYYDPVVGRFVSRDPLGLWGDPSQNGNGQGYCGHNPVNLADPLGLDDDWGWLKDMEAKEAAEDAAAADTPPDIPGPKALQGKPDIRIKEQSTTTCHVNPTGLAGELAVAAAELTVEGLAVALLCSNPWTAAALALFIASQIESCDDPLLEAKLIAALTIYAEAGPGPGMTHVRGAGAAGEGAAAAPKTGPARAAEFAGSEDEAVLLEALARREVTHPPGTVMGMGSKGGGLKVGDPDFFKPNTILRPKPGDIHYQPGGIVGSKVDGLKTGWDPLKAGGSPPFKDSPKVVEFGGKQYAVDGNHRLAAASEGGFAVPVRVMSPAEYEAWRGKPFDPAGFSPTPSRR